MSKSAVIQKLENKQLKKRVTKFEVGDTIRVHIRIIEGDKERTQVFMGTVIGRSGTGIGETFTMHRVAYGEGMERVFMLHSPRISDIEVVKRGKVRRAKLYYLRGTQGKAAKVKSKVGPQNVAQYQEYGVQEEVEVVAEETPTEETASAVVETEGETQE